MKTTVKLQNVMSCGLPQLIHKGLGELNGYSAYGSSRSTTGS
ncbi:MAG: hypothetical protein ACLR8Y_06385 [Alistipes indistinctus]